MEVGGGEMKLGIALEEEDGGGGGRDEAGDSLGGGFGSESGPGPGLESRLGSRLGSRLERSGRVWTSFLAVERTLRPARFNRVDCGLLHSPTTYG